MTPARVMLGPGLGTSKEALGLVNSLLKKQASPVECISVTDALNKVKGVEALAGSEADIVTLEIFGIQIYSLYLGYHKA